ncbi:RNF213 [Mytilus edulis]|uniref:RNF213 n=1 Tax=Mytilus edulis TaxID=6550 RepID=A0A8S3PUK2_MYTED|nr:RNF213 [Mytilus edulis]
MTEELQKILLSESVDSINSLTIPLHEKILNTDEVMNVLLDVTLPPEIIVPRIFHFDISHEVQEGVDDFLFDLIILGSLHHSSGNVWRKDAIDYYIIESMPPLSKGTGVQEDTFTCMHHCLEVLPDILCRAPQESLNILNKTAIPKDYSTRDRLFDQIEFQSTLFQRPYQYLKRHDTNSKLTDINPKSLWSKRSVMVRIAAFCWFLDKQLRDFEVSNFCSAAVLEDLPGFPQFVLKFLIQMSRDFSTRSLNISEETPLDCFKRQMLEDDDTVEDENFVELYAMRRTWETRCDKLAKLCDVMGVATQRDPDESYELTTDNVKKILAIYMRFRIQDSDFVIFGKYYMLNYGATSTVLGETQVHGGTKASDIIRKVKKAEEIAKKNAKLIQENEELAPYKHMDTVLFFDEANTTEAIGIIKEITCDKSLLGRPIELHEKLKMVAACNPYRKFGKSSKLQISVLHCRHSEELIRRLEQAGLGYHVEADKTSDKLGRVPMRRLVYRVQPLPQSMLPLVWDFGQLNINVEEILRDVERVLDVMSWFYAKSIGNDMLFEQLADDNNDEIDAIDQPKVIDHTTRSLVLALGVCYHSCLKKRFEYRHAIAKHFQDPLELTGGANQIDEEISNPLSTPEGIVGTFAQCASYQKEKDLNRFVSVVVLDEIGLAEDSPRMPLKTLHPLLEDGCPDDEEPAPYKKVAFIGISNWALDPAKMNRGILVRREVPNEVELINSAKGICSSDKIVQSHIEPMIPAMASAYLRVFKKLQKKKGIFWIERFLQVRVNLIKMLYGFIWISKEKPTWFQLKHSILRNFGGLEMIDPVSIFLELLSSQVDECEEKRPTDPDCSADGMIQACLKEMIILLENYGALAILEQNLFTMQNAVVIFGSSFPSDQEYTQVCRNINRIKVCMETGCTVILLNLENLYESLYDALNQYYVVGGERYVDLGLGSHRVKCRVHRKFRLIVVAEKQVVYKKFPILHWLINQACLEKHFLSMKTLLILQDAKGLLLWCATPAAVLQGGDEFDKNTYFHQQEHESLADYISFKMRSDQHQTVFAQITTNSRILSTLELDDLAEEVPVSRKNIHLLTLQSFHTEQQFSRQIKSCFSKKIPDSILIVQSESGDQNEELIACARYSAQRELQEILQKGVKSKIYVIFLVQLTGLAGNYFSGYQCGLWQSVHIDDLRISFIIPPIIDMLGKTAATVITATETNPGITAQVKLEKEVSDRDGGKVQSDENNEDLEQINSNRTIDQTQESNRTIDKTQESNRSIDQTQESNRSFDQTQESNISIDQTQESNRSIDQTQEGLYKQIAEAKGMKRKKTGIKLLHQLLLRNDRALSALKDPKEDVSRTTQRLKIVLNLLENDKGTILSGICKHVVKLINEKEKKFGSLSNWLSAEVSKSENINKAGTFSPRTSKIFKSVYGHDKNHENNSLDIIMKAADIFQSLSIGCLLHEIDGPFTKTALQFYIEDFVHTVYPFKTENECRLVCENVAIGAQKLLKGEYGNLLPTMFACHMVL